MFYPQLVDEPVDNRYLVYTGGDMRFRSVVLALAVGTAALVAGCEADREAKAPAPAPAQLAAAAPGPNVVTFDGVRNIAFGDSASDLTARGLLTRPREGCGPQLADLPEASPVFLDKRLVLLWANPPLTTPEGIGVDSTLADARAAYPQATDLPAPKGSHRFDALMTTEDDRAFLFLHDGQKVRKLIAGYTEDARRLLDTGFGSC
jgi:hypothetical protein